MKTKLLAILLMLQIGAQASTTPTKKSIVDPCDMPPSHELKDDKAVALNTYARTIYNTYFHNAPLVQVALAENTKHILPITIMAVVDSIDITDSLIGSIAPVYMHGGRLFVDPNSSRLVPIDTGELHQGIIYYPPEGLRSVSVQNYDPVLVFENNTKLTVFFEEEISKDNLEDNNERSSNIMIDVGLFGNKAVRIKSVEKDKLSILLNWNKYLNTKLVSTEQRLDLIRQAGKNNVTKYPINIKHKTGPQDFGTLYYLKKTIGELQNKK